MLPCRSVRRSSRRSSLNSQSLEYISNGVRQRPPAPETIGLTLVEGFQGLWQRGLAAKKCAAGVERTDGRLPAKVSAELTLELIRGLSIVSLMTNSAVMTLRVVARRVGLVNAAMSLLRSVGYEQLLTKAMAARLMPGACVWDVGANVGHYTTLFAERVGSSGRVYAFEPLPTTVSKLAAATGGLDNVSILPVALSDRTGNATIDPGDEDQLATARIEEDGAVPIELRTGDHLISTGTANLPTMVKIDVEGHEFEVLRGMTHALRAGTLRDIFIEVHFAIFAATGRSDRPALIERLLSECSFKLRWIDQSHLHAYR